MTPKFYGLTGGIGSGKSTAAQYFSKLGAPVLDLDKVGHHILSHNKEAQQQLIHAFGSSILTNHNIDRKKLGTVAFQSNQAISLLNSIIHPYILDAEQDWRGKQHAPFAIIEASVLIESNGASRMDGLMVVLADEKVRIKRVMKRSSLSEEAIKQIIQRQCSDHDRKKHANYILNNNTSLVHLERQVTKLYQKLSTKH